MLLWRLLWLGNQLLRRARLHLVLRVAIAAGLISFLATFAQAGEDYKICYRADAAPFSFMADDGAPRGYSVDLCRHALASLGTEDPEMVPVTAEDRFDRLIKDQACHVLCEATTVTMRRRQDMEFSLITFLTGAAFLFPKSLLIETEKTEAVMKVGFLEGTTVHENSENGGFVNGATFNFSFEPVESHEAAVLGLTDGTLQGYVADREILEQILAESPSLAELYQVGRQSLSYEPYALAVRMGDDRTRTAIDEVLAELYRTGEIRKILSEYIPQRRFDPILMNLFELQSLPE